MSRPPQLSATSAPNEDYSYVWGSGVVQFAGGTPFWRCIRCGQCQHPETHAHVPVLTECTLYGLNDLAGAAQHLRDVHDQNVGSSLATTNLQATPAASIQSTTTTKRKATMTVTGAIPSHINADTLRQRPPKISKKNSRETVASSTALSDVLSSEGDDDPDFRPKPTRQNSRIVVYYDRIRAAWGEQWKDAIAPCKDHTLVSNTTMNYCRNMAFLAEAVPADSLSWVRIAVAMALEEKNSQHKAHAGASAPYLTAGDSAKILGWWGERGIRKEIWGRVDKDYAASREMAEGELLIVG